MSISNYDGVIKAVAKGNVNALELLYDDLSKTVFALAYSILQNRELAEDVMQDTFIRVKLSAEAYQSRGKGRAWVLKIARNLSLNMLNKQKKEVALENVLADAEARDNTEALVENCLLLSAAMKILTRDEREIVLLHTHEGLLHREIARVTGKPVNTVKWIYSKALKKLSAQLDGVMKAE